MRYDISREPQMCKPSEEERIPIETLLKKASKRQFLTKKEKARVYQYEAEKRALNKKKKR